MLGWNAGWKVMTSWQFGFLGQNSSSLGTTFKLNLLSSHQLFLFFACAFLKAWTLPYENSRICRFCNTLVGKARQYHLFVLLSSMYTLIQVRMCFHKVHKVLWGSCSLIMFSTVVESPQGHLGGTRAGPCVSLIGLLGLPHPALCLCAPLCVCVHVHKREEYFVCRSPSCDIPASSWSRMLFEFSHLLEFLWAPLCSLVPACLSFFPHAHSLLPVFTWLFMPIYSQ